MEKIKGCFIKLENYGLYGSREFFSTGWSGVLPAKPKDIYLALKSYMNSTDDISYPSTKRLELDTLMNGTDVRTSIEFLNLMGMIDIIRRGNSFIGKSSEYRILDIYKLNLLLEPLFLDSLYEILNDRVVKTSKNEGKSNNRKIYSDRLNSIKKIIDRIKNEEIKLIFRIRGQLEKGVDIPDYKYKRKKNEIVNNSNAYDYLEKPKLSLIKELMKAIYAALRVSDRPEDLRDYNRLIFSLYLKNQNELRDGVDNSKTELDSSDTDNQKPSCDTNIQYNKQENRQYNIDDEQPLACVDIEIPDFQIDTNDGEKDFFKPPKVKTLLKDLKRQLKVFSDGGLSEMSIIYFLHELEAKDEKCLKEVQLCFKILNEAKFVADNPPGYVKALVDMPSVTAAEASVIKFMNSFRNENKSSKNPKAKIEPVPRDYYDKYFND